MSALILIITALNTVCLIVVIAIQVNTKIALLNWARYFQREINQIMADLSALTAQVAANTTVIESAITLIQGLKTKLDAAGTDPVKLKELSDSLGAEDAKLAQAVVDNTPAT